MNPLAALKEKMMIKPNIEEREKVAILIKGVKPNKRVPAEKKEPVKKKEQPSAPKLKLEGDEPIDWEDVEEEEEKEESVVKAVKETSKDGPIIVDATEKGFDVYPYRNYQP
jgi:hypothetical protein